MLRESRFSCSGRVSWKDQRQVYLFCECPIQFHVVPYKNINVFKNQTTMVHILDTELKQS